MPRPILFSRGLFPAYNVIFPRSFPRTILFSRGLFRVIFYRFILLDFKF